MRLRVRVQHVFCLALVCLSRVSIEIQSAVDGQYLNLSGEFVEREKQKGQFYAEIEDGDMRDFRFRIVDGRGRALGVKRKRQKLVWTRGEGMLWSVRRPAGGDTGHVMTDAGLCMKHSPDRVYLERCPESESAAACSDCMFRVAFRFSRKQLGECRMALEAERERARACCEGEEKPACNECETTALCERAPVAVRVLEAERVPCGDFGKRVGHSAMPSVSQSPKVAGEACRDALAWPGLSMLLSGPDARQSLLQASVSESAGRGGIPSSIISRGEARRERHAPRDEDMPGGGQYLTSSSHDGSGASRGGLDSAAVKEICSAVATLIGDRGKSAQSGLESMRDILMKNLSSETLEAMAKEKKRLEDNEALEIGMLSKKLAELKSTSEHSKAPLQEQKSSAENALDRVAKATADTRNTTEKMAQTINSAAGELHNISKALGSGEAKKNAGLVSGSMESVADLAKSFVPPPLALATGILSKLGI